MKVSKYRINFEAILNDVTDEEVIKLFIEALDQAGYDAININVECIKQQIIDDDDVAALDEFVNG